MTSLTIIKGGGAFDALAAARGGIETWICRLLGASLSEVEVVEAYQGAALPDPRLSNAVVITGSAAMITEHRPWAEAVADWLGPILSREIPVLGICFGHQLLAYHLGGVVGPNPSGREIGTTTVEVTQASRRDPLFSGLPQRLTVQMLHEQSVLRLPRGAVALAENTHGPYQAARYGRRAWGVQFHPEFDSDIMGRYLEHLAPELASEGLKLGALKAALRDMPCGTNLLRQFSRRILHSARASGYHGLPTPNLSLGESFS